MVKNTLETLIGLVGLTVALTGCPGDDTGSDTNNTTNPTTGVNTTGMESTGGDTMTEPPATDEGSSSEGGGDTTTSGPPMGCDPPCPMGEECVEGACFPAACDPPCGADQMCVAGVCEDMPPPAGSDYGPCDMCAPGEMPVTIGMLDGCFCSPMCDGMSCPTPNEGTASAQCVLELMAGAGPTQCALICMTTEDCPPGATCEDAGGGSVCIHPQP